MEEVKAKQEKEVDKEEKIEGCESGCVSLKSPGKVRTLMYLPYPSYCSISILYRSLNENSASPCIFYLQFLSPISNLLNFSMAFEQ
jgi:hypothetical protein